MVSLNLCKEYVHNVGVIPKTQFRTFDIYKAFSYIIA